LPAAARLLRVPLDELALAPQEVLLALAREPWPFALTGAWAGGGAIVGAGPLRVAAPEEDPFALLEELPAVADPDPAAVGGGWFGWLGYGLGARVERLAPPPPRPVPLPPFQLAYYDHVLRLDADGRWWFEALATPERAEALEGRLAELRALVADAVPAQPPAVPGPFRLAGAGANGHLAAVSACRERIAAGEIFQANLCLRLEAEWDGDVAALYARASERLQPAYGAAFPAPWGGIASLSPELFLRRRGREVTTAPIKGTLPRASGAPDDPARAALLRSAKDHAEHVMIVDLMRNDLGRVCAYGSVVAEPAPVAEPHPGVWHLVSRVRGRVRDDAGDGALVRAAFPPGSVTGAPKVQALHVIGELEATGREAYTGAIGFASPVAGLELSVAIRTFEACGGRLWLGAGGGIVADSDPLLELEECLVKARPLVEAVGGRVERGGAGGAGPPPIGVARPRRNTPLAETPHPAALDRGRRPDLGWGVFSTLLVCSGEAVRVDAHLSRLAGSVAVLYGAELPEDLAVRVAEAAAVCGDGVLRVGARPGAVGALEVVVGPGAERERVVPVRLAPFVLPGGLGAHKWQDRRLLDALAREAGGATPLIVDGDGTVLEAAWGNVFALEGELLLTPAADGRLLPGVTRAALVELAAGHGLEPAEVPLTLERLAAADAVVLTSALAGAVPATLGSPSSEVGASALVRDLTGLLGSPVLAANR
jgi:anthranilate/para-aminobenzoate synthase component I/branched-subunit amino acid aminotransferase/4-amino-4-deoxychorismate lyase